MGVALAAGGIIKTQSPRLRGVALDQHRLSPRVNEARPRQRRALSPRRRRDLSNRSRVSGALGNRSRVGGAISPPTGNGDADSPTSALVDAKSATPTDPTASPPVVAEDPNPVTPAPPTTPAPPAEEPLPTPPEETLPPPPGESTPSALYWGASIGSQLTGVQAPWDMGAVTKFEQIADKKVSLVNFFSPFANCPAGGSCSFYKFPTGPMESIREYGAIPVFSWSSQSIPSTLSEPNFQLSDVIAGTYDSYIREFAQAARKWGHPFFLRFDWEMNGNWFPWSEGVNGNQSGEFVAAWRHVHDIFTSVGASNVTWVWCPNVDPEGVLHDLGSLYPGDEYVDWTGLDGYNWGTNPANPDRWRSFNELYESTYHRIADAVAPDKPMLIGEMGSTEDGGSKASWIEEALTAIPTDYTQIHGLLWFDTYDDGMDWPIETSASSANAFASAIQSPAYVAESAVEIAEGPIEPPESPETTEALSEPLG
ncbi:MAG TPA: glycosyl hydrolase [Solirubrobacterales bacterium]|jgi:hypothetical protein|nr:glycosyl hydrolase [Solirubrobacterales bacterium]